eukprot:CAMPEP_0184493958 /NCGR_PEP_ID=MMETSP0113_2-20130426/27430_1 /TAXON_ID=91329 /ORGANISM="Norrisiella sphaerica, Strain BC52" /LENGTH=80 /DNA_ID=CAMNT_0026879467 /DNA_START=467 /DNA_END=706 /DNA_ORIENTATION=+
MTPPKPIQLNEKVCLDYAVDMEEQQRVETRTHAIGASLQHWASASHVCFLSLNHVHAGLQGRLDRLVSAPPVRNENTRSP